VFDHTSIPAMVKKTFGLPNCLTKRDAATNTFEHVFNVTPARTNAPQKIGAAATVAHDEWAMKSRQQTT
jgi:hypothetical protein